MSATPSRSRETLTKAEAAAVSDMYPRYPADVQMFINGEQGGAASGATMEVINPATGAVVDSVPRADAADTRRAVDAAAAAFRTWSKTPATKRAHILESAARPVRGGLEGLPRLLTSEQGKPIRDSRIEAE